MIRPLALVGALALAAVSSMAYAQQPAPGAAPQRVPAARGPEMALALEAAQTAVSTCATNGYKVAASIVDSAGAQVLVAAMAPPRNGRVSTKKAVTAEFDEPRPLDQEKIKTDPALAIRSARTPTFDEKRARPALSRSSRARPAATGTSLHRSRHR